MAIFSGESVRATRRGIPAALRRHWLLVVFLVLGLVLRVIVQLAYRPSLLYIDSFRYVNQLATLDPTGLDPIGYTLFYFKPVIQFGGLGLAVAVQHVLGLAMVVLLYVLLQRAGAPRWLSAIATLPLLLDAYQVQIEHTIMSDELFQILMLVLFALLTWRRRPGAAIAGTAGLLIAVLISVRLVAVTLAFPVIVYLLLAAGAWRNREAWLRRAKTVGALVLGLAVGVGAYAAYFQSWTGQWGITAAHTNSLYGRVAVAADCDRITGDARKVCPPSDIEDRDGPDYYSHSPHSPVADLLAAGENYGDIAQWIGQFNGQVLHNQPLDVAGGVLLDFAKGFRWERTDAPGDVPVSRWQFQTTYPRFDFDPYNPDPAQPEKTLRMFGYEQPEVSRELAGFLRGYQLSVGYTPGPFLALGLLLGILGIFAPRSRRPWLRWPCLLVVGLSLTILFTAAVVEFSWRYQLPSLLLLPLAGVLGVTAWLRPPAATVSAAVAQDAPGTRTAPEDGTLGEPVHAEAPVGEPATVTGEGTEPR